MTRWSVTDYIATFPWAQSQSFKEYRSMTVHDAEPGDVYVDGSGKLWRCVAVHNEPTLVFEEVEPRSAAGKSTMQAPARPGLWNGWKRIWRPERDPSPGTQMGLTNTPSLMVRSARRVT